MYCEVDFQIIEIQEAQAGRDLQRPSNPAAHSTLDPVRCFFSNHILKDGHSTTYLFQCCATHVSGTKNKNKYACIKSFLLTFWILILQGSHIKTSICNAEGQNQNSSPKPVFSYSCREVTSKAEPLRSTLTTMRLVKSCKSLQPQFPKTLFLFILN